VAGAVGGLLPSDGVQDIYKVAQWLMGTECALKENFTCNRFYNLRAAHSDCVQQIACGALNM
jgi:hypothetical protein